MKTKIKNLKYIYLENVVYKFIEKYREKNLLEITVFSEIVVLKNHILSKVDISSNSGLLEKQIIDLLNKNVSEKGKKIIKNDELLYPTLMKSCQKEVYDSREELKASEEYVPISPTLGSVSCRLAIYENYDKLSYIKVEDVLRVSNGNVIEFLNINKPEKLTDVYVYNKEDNDIKKAGLLFTKEDRLGISWLKKYMSTQGYEEIKSHIIKALEAEKKAYLSLEEAIKGRAILEYITELGYDYEIVPDREKQVKVKLKGMGMDIRIVDLKDKEFIGRIFDNNRIIRYTTSEKVKVNGKLSNKLYNPNSTEILDLIRFTLGEKLENRVNKEKRFGENVQYEIKGKRLNSTYLTGNNKSILYKKLENNETVSIFVEYHKDRNEYKFHGKTWKKKEQAIEYLEERIKEARKNAEIELGIKFNIEKFFDNKIGNFELKYNAEYGWKRFNPYYVIKYSDMERREEDRIRDISYAIKKAEINREELIFNTYIGKKIGDELIEFDENTAVVMKNHSSEFIRSIYEIVEEVLNTNGGMFESENILIDKNGIIKFAGKKIRRQSVYNKDNEDNYTNDYVGYLGQVFIPDVRGGIQTNFLVSENYYAIPKTDVATSNLRFDKENYEESIKSRIKYILSIRLRNSSMCEVIELNSIYSKYFEKVIK